MQRAVTDLSRRAGVRFTRTAGIQDGARAFDRDVMAVTGKTSRRQGRLAHRRHSLDRRVAARTVQETV